MSVRDRQRDERCDNLQLEACVGARVEPLDAHLLGLTVNRLNHATIGSDGQLVAPGLRAHLLAVSRDEPNASVGQRTGGIGGADGGLIADEPRPQRQDEGHLVDRRQVVIGRWQELEADRHAVRRTDEMQAPAKQPLVLGCTIAAKHSPARVATAPRADTTADRRGHAVDDERGGRGRGRAKPSPQKTIHHNLVDKPLGIEALDEKARAIELMLTDPFLDPAGWNEPEAHFALKRALNLLVHAMTVRQEESGACCVEVEVYEARESSAFESTWESNPPARLVTPPNGFEDRGSHRATSALGAILAPGRVRCQTEEGVYVFSAGVSTQARASAI